MLSSQSGELLTERFDAELVVLVDKEFSPKDTFDSVVADRNTGRTQMVDDLPIRMLSGHSKLSPRRRVGMGSREISKLNLEMAEIRDQVRHWVGQQVLESLLEGPVKMAFLIDSEGGDIEVQNECLRAAEFVAQNGGEVSGYVTGSAQSAAFSVMAAAEKIHVLAKSSLLWHFSSTNDGVERARTVRELRSGVRLSKRNSRELEELFVLLRRSPYFSPKTKDHFLQVIKDPANEEGEVTMNGEELATLGIADYFYDGVKRMAKWFHEDFVAMDNQFVRDFWILSDLIIKGLPEDSDWQKFGFEKARGDLKKSLDKNFGKKRRMRQRFLKKMHNEV